MINAGIIGATGYAGCELLRILLNHQKVKLAAISSVTFKGQKIAAVYKNFYNLTDLVCESADDVIEKSDVVFTALPSGLSEDIAYKCIKKGKILIDLGADFRLSDEAEYKEWYGKSFAHPDIHKLSCYGLPELNREKIKSSKIIANPGCYPTSIELALMPLLKNSLINTDDIICDSASGATGSGRSLTLAGHFSELNENYAPYKVGQHRHTPEIEEILGFMCNHQVKVTFTPHLLPMSRGILSTIYCTPKGKINLDKIHELYCETYKNERFVNILDISETACTKNVRYSNLCNISLHENYRKDKLIIVSAIDNMVKGAAGQAVQNMNLTLGFNEDEGLNFISPSF